MAPARRFLWWLAHAGCAGACLALWERPEPSPAHVPPPPARWRMERHADRTLWVHDLASRRSVAAPNPLPRLGPVALAPGFNPNFWALADGHRVKIISLQTGEAVASFVAPLGGVERLCWLDDDRLAVVARADHPWLIHRLSTGKQTHLSP